MTLERDSGSGFGEEAEPILPLEEKLRIFAGKLGFIETDEVIDVLEKLARTESGEDVSDLIAEWQVAARESVEKNKHAEGVPADLRLPQIGLLVASTELFVRLDMPDEAMEEYGDALELAEGYEYMELADRMKAMVRWSAEDTSSGE